MTLILHEITTLSDEALPLVMDIYQRSFPPREQVQYSWWVRLFQKLGMGEKRTGSLVALREVEAGTVLGMAYYEINKEREEEDKPERLGFLWYLATHHEQRDKGIGAAFYQALVSRLLDDEGCAALVFEIEIAEEVAQTYPNDPEAAALARRREHWYQRNGARKLTGVHYEQSVGWQPAMPMHLLLHSRKSLTPEIAFAYVQQLTYATQTGPLGLEPSN